MTRTSLTAQTSPRRRVSVAATVLLGAAVVLTACADESSQGASSAGGVSVEYGAGPEEFEEALADMEPVTLHLQSSAPKGAPTGRRFEEYAAAVEEWSGGKISFDIAFANAVAEPADVDDALADGRIDVGSVIVALDPTKFPASNVLWDLSFIGQQTPVDGLLQWHGAMLQVASETPEIEQEFADNGLKLLLPTYSSGSYFFDCTAPTVSRDDFEGKTISSQSRVQSSQAEALGMSPSTISYAEMYESLQRSVIDCAASTMTTSTLGGFIPAAPHFSFSPDTGLSAPGGGIAVNLDVWNDLPLAAQQLMYDRLDVLLEVNLASAWDNVAIGLEEIDQAGGEVVEIDDDAEAALRQANDDAFAAAESSDALGDGAAFVQRLQDAEAAWLDAVANMAIDGVDVGYDEFVSWYESSNIDLQPYFDKLWGDTLADHRPS